MKVVSNTIRIRWDARILVLPLMGKAGSTHYHIECPSSGTIGTGQTFDADGLSFGSTTSNYSALYYVVPVGSTSVNTLVSNFRLVPLTSTIENMEPHWVLVAVVNSEANHTQVKWQPGSVVLPLPDIGHQIRWNSAVLQLGRSANKIVLDGTAGSATIPGWVTATAAAAPQYRVSPATSGQESSIGFYRNSNLNVSNAGDAWVIGQSAWGVGAGNFAIGRHNSEALNGCGGREHPRKYHHRRYRGTENSVRILSRRR